MAASFLQAIADCADTVREIRLDGEQVEHIAIQDQFEFLLLSRVAWRLKRPTWLRSAQQSLECRLLSLAESIENGVAIGKVEIANDKNTF